MQTKKNSIAAAASSKIGAKNISAGPADKKMKKGENLFHDLFIDELKDIYWAEKHLVKNLPKLVKAATTTELKDAISNHLRETEEQVKKVERVFELIGEKPQAKKCDAMDGLVEEASSIIEETEKGTYTRDAALITAAQKVEHYEIASYGALAAFAKTMGHDDAAAILVEILEEEKNADDGLNDLAKKSINEKAMAEWTGDAKDSAE
ncbi:MAG: ferritin-like domain-containing protein [Bacteroidota bacterium]